MRLLLKQDLETVVQPPIQRGQAAPRSGPPHSSLESVGLYDVFETLRRPSAPKGLHPPGNPTEALPFMGAVRGAAGQEEAALGGAGGAAPAIRQSQPVFAARTANVLFQQFLQRGTLSQRL